MRDTQDIQSQSADQFRQQNDQLGDVLVVDEARTGTDRQAGWRASAASAWTADWVTFPLASPV